MQDRINGNYERILTQATKLFAEQGFEAVSMRDIAKVNEIKAPSLYNHFKDKKALYQACLQAAFQQHNSQLNELMTGESPVEIKLKKVIALSLLKMAQDSNFRLLIQRELLQNDKQRLQFLAEEVMHHSCQQLEAILKILAPDADHHFVITTLMGLVMFHVQIGPMREFLPGANINHEQIDYLSESIYQLCLQALTP